MNLEVRITQAQLIELVKAKFADKKLPPCSFCGGYDRRDIIGVQWLSIDNDLAYTIKPAKGSDLERAIRSPGSVDPQKPIEADAAFDGPVHTRPAVMPCVVMVCSGCGNTWLLTANAIGIFSFEHKATNVLKLIRGGLDENRVTDPDSAPTT